MQIISKSLKDTQKIAQDFVASISAGENNAKAKIVGLYGDLGAGKTTFTQSVARILGIKETVTSPTFVIEKIYPVKPDAGYVAGKFTHFIHIDAYRLESGKEMLSLGWKEITENPKNLIFIEWAERIADILPADMQKIYFKFIDENTREIDITP